MDKTTSSANEVILRAMWRTAVRRCGRSSVFSDDKVIGVGDVEAVDFGLDKVGEELRYACFEL